MGGQLFAAMPKAGILGREVGDPGWLGRQRARIRRRHLLRKPVTVTAAWRQRRRSVLLRWLQWPAQGPGRAPAALWTSPRRRAT